MTRFAIQHKLVLVIVGTLAVVVVGLTAIPVYDALSPGHLPDILSRPIAGAVLAGLLVLMVSVIAVFCVHRLVLRPLGRLTGSVRAIVEAKDYSRSVTEVGVPALDAVSTDINQLIAAIRQRDEAIDTHEIMERNLDDWMKKRRSYELELKEARMAAEDANLIKSHFLASVSHELRTPLHTMMSYARFGERDAAEGRFEDAAEYFEVILDSGDLLLLLLNDLLDLSKLESGKMNFNLAPTSLGDVVGCVVDQFQVSLKQQNLKVVLDLREPDVVFVDSSRTVQVARNLIENAIKYTRPNSSIFVDVYNAHNNVTLCVRDQGEGVPDQELDSIFESFRQLGDAKSVVGGVGLGLAISRQIVVFQQGKIWAENHAEGGLAVFVQFDACGAERPAEKQIGQAARS